MRHACALGLRKARARQAGTARPAIAHAAPLTSRFYRALRVDGPWRTRALLASALPTDKLRAARETIRPCLQTRKACTLPLWRTWCKTAFAQGKAF